MLYMEINAVFFLKSTRKSKTYCVVKRIVPSCSNLWYMYLPPGFKGLIQTEK
jgi:hypothetical protein